MPKPRRKDTTPIGQKFIILCEGSKTEPQYFKGLRASIKASKLIDIEIVDTEYTSCVELVDQALRIREKNRLQPNDQIWVVVDKDGYSEHHRCFDKANSTGINIALSSISFEFWVLLHFEYTTTPRFSNSKDIIHKMKDEQYIDYKKSMSDLYEFLYPHLEKARTNAQRLRNHHDSTSPRVKPYNLNPYTNVDELVFAIIESNKKKSSCSH